MYQYNQQKAALAPRQQMMIQAEQKHKAETLGEQPINVVAKKKRKNTRKSTRQNGGI